MDPKKIAILMVILGLTELKADSEGKATLSKDQVGKIQAAFNEKFGKKLELKGLTFDDKNNASFDEKQLSAIEQAFVGAMADAFAASLINPGTTALNPTAAPSASPEPVPVPAPSATLEELQAQLQAEQALRVKDQERITALTEQIAALGQKTETIDLSNMSGQSDFKIPTAGYNAVTDSRWWNRAAVMIARDGDTRGANALFASSELDVTQVQQDLGQYFRERHPQIEDFLVRTDNTLDRLFPAYPTGIKDELVVTDLFSGEFLQAYNEDWTEKGKFEFQPEKIKLKDYKVDHRFKATQLREFIYSWLATQTQGTDPFQKSLVAFLYQQMLDKIKEEIKIAMIQGVYLQSPKGVAGPMIQSVNGLLKTLQTIREGFRVKPFGIGHWDESFDSEQHIYKLIAKGSRMIPRKLRDNTPSIIVLTSPDGRDAYNLFIEKLAQNTNITAKDFVRVPANVTVEAVPNWNSKVLVWVLPGNIRQFYRQQGEDNKFYTQYEKRDTIVFMDGARAIGPIKSGYEYASAAEQTYDNQIIFLSEEFDDYTYIEALADDITPSVKVHNCLKLGNNAAATAITNIDDAISGQTIYLYGDATVNAATIANGATFLLEADWVANRGNKLVLKKVGAKFIEIGRYGNTDDPNVIEFTADDATPSVELGAEFITSPDNAAPLTITDFDGGEADKVYRIHGGGGANATTIATSANIVLVGASLVMTVGKWIDLYLTQSGIYKEIGRSA